MEDRRTLFSVMTKITDFDSLPDAREVTNQFLKDMFDRLIDTKPEFLPGYIHEYSIAEVFATDDDKILLEDYLAEKIIATGFGSDVLLSLIPILYGYAYALKNQGLISLSLESAFPYFSYAIGKLYPAISEHHLVATVGRCSLLKESIPEIVKRFNKEDPTGSEIHPAGYCVSNSMLSKVTQLTTILSHLYLPIEAEQLCFVEKDTSVKSFLVKDLVMVCPKRKYVGLLDMVNSRFRFADIRELFAESKQLCDKVNESMSQFNK